MKTLIVAIALSVSLILVPTTIASHKDNLQSVIKQVKVLIEQVEQLTLRVQTLEAQLEALKPKPIVIQPKVEQRITVPKYNCTGRYCVAP